MDFLKELGITLLVGAFTILGAEAILHYFFDKGFVGFFEGKLGLEESATVGKEQTMTIAVFIAFAFAVGVVSEDLSHKFRDSKEIRFKTIPATILPESVIKWFELPPKDYDDRVVTLIRSLEDPHPAPLAIDLANNNAFQITSSSNYFGRTQIQIDDKNIGAPVERWIRSPARCKPLPTPSPTPSSGTLASPRPDAATHDCPDTSEMQTAIDNLYYHAKNTVYANEQHNQELKKIQARLEFTRSLSMISFIYFLIALVIGTPLFIALLAQRKDKRNSASRSNKLRAKIPVVVGTLLLVYFFSLWAFALETQAFNKRAFGYFSTMLIQEKRKPKDNGGDEPRKNASTSSASPTPTPTPRATP